MDSGLATVTNEGGRAHGLLNITKADFLDPRHSLPSHCEQSAIATVLSDMETELAAIGSQARQSPPVKQGMMQELLTGRIRLI